MTPLFWVLREEMAKKENLFSLQEMYSFQRDTEKCFQKMQEKCRLHMQQCATTIMLSNTKMVSVLL
jgi:hypothetical protein